MFSGYAFSEAPFSSLAVMEALATLTEVSSASVVQASTRSALVSLSDVMSAANTQSSVNTLATNRTEPLLASHTQIAIAATIAARLEISSATHVQLSSIAAAAAHVAAVSGANSQASILGKITSILETLVSAEAQARILAISVARSEPSTVAATHASVLSSAKATLESNTLSTVQNAIRGNVNSVITEPVVSNSTQTRVLSIAPKPAVEPSLSAATHAAVLTSIKAVLESNTLVAVQNGVRGNIIPLVVETAASNSVQNRVLTIATKSLTDVSVVSDVESRVLGAPKSITEPPPGIVVPPSDLLFSKVAALLHMDGAPGSTTFVDSSPFPKSVVVYGTTQVSADSKFGTGSMNIVTQGNRATVGVSSDWHFLQRQDRSYTVEVQVKLASNPAAYQFILMTNDSNGPSTAYYALILTPSLVPYFAIGHLANTYNVNSAGTGVQTPLVVGVWAQLIHVYDHVTRTHRLYLDGVLQSSFVKNALFPTTESPNQPLVIGSYPINPYPQFLTGRLDELRITSGAVRSPEVQASAFPHEDPSVDVYYGNVVLLLHLDGTNGSTTFVDSSPTPKTVTAVETAQLRTAQSKFGPSSLWLDGSGDYLSIADSEAWNFGTGDFTAEAWVWVSSFALDQEFIAQRAPADQDSFWFLRVKTNGTIRAVNKTLSVVTTDIVSVGTVSLNTWAHVALTRRLGVCKIWVSGSNNDVVTTNTAGTFSNPALPLLIGAGDPVSSYFNGYIDEVRITKGVARYTSNFPVPTSAFLNTAADPSSDADYSSVSLLLHCNEGSGATTQDFSPSPKVVTLAGGVFLSTAAPKLGAGSLYFNGGGTSVVSSPNNSAFTFGSGKFTVEVWFYLLSVPSGVGYYRVLAAHDNIGVTRGWIFLVDGDDANKLAFAVWDGATRYTVAAPVATVAGVWVHGAAVRDGSTLNLYVNGVRQSSVVMGPVPTNNPGMKLTIGSGHALGNDSLQMMHGYIDELRITKGVARYTSDFIPQTIEFPNSGPVLQTPGADSLQNSTATMLKTVRITELASPDATHTAFITKYRTENEVSAVASTSQRVLTSNKASVETQAAIDVSVVSGVTANATISNPSTANASHTRTALLVKLATESAASTATHTAVALKFAAQLESSTGSSVQSSIGGSVKTASEPSVANSVSTRSVVKSRVEVSNANNVQGAALNSLASIVESSAIDTSVSSLKVSYVTSTNVSVADGQHSATMYSIKYVSEIGLVMDSVRSKKQSLVEAESLPDRPPAKIPPIDNFIREGFALQMKKQFRCPAIFVSSIDKLRTLQMHLGGETPSYPYIFMAIQSTSPNNDSFMSGRLARQGVPVSLNTDNNQFQMVRLLPANFEIEILYITNKYSSVDTDSVEGYVRRWLFARRNGSLGFTVDYGLTQLGITYNLVESVPLPPRENPADQESIYQITTTATVHGFISEPELGSRGRINQIVLTDPGQLAEGSKFFPF
jgi:hypothetical protein